MDKDKMLEKFVQCIKSKPTDQLIRDLEEYNIKVVGYTPDDIGSINMRKLRISHFPQIPCNSFIVEVKDLYEAKKVMDILADYDYFQYKNNIKPDYSNMAIVEEWDEDEKYSGRFVVRIPKNLHKRLSIEAEREGVSLNQYTMYKLSK